MSQNLKNRWKSMKIANSDREILHIFWTTHIDSYLLPSTGEVVKLAGLIVLAGLIISIKFPFKMK